jgi:lipopolysaccharide/colanic/teichoic acid biosynthesis glycosyltransferase
MKKNGRTTNNRSLLQDFRWNVFSGGSMALAWPQPRKQGGGNRKKRYAPRPHLEKIGGMEPPVRAFIRRFLDPAGKQVSIVRTSIAESIRMLPENCEAIINLKRLNDIRSINAFLSSVNRGLPEGGLYVGCVETKYLRRQRVLRKFPPVLNYGMIFVDFVYKRVFPKLPVTRDLYRVLSGDRNKVLSKTEALGRLYAAGFELVEERFIGNLLWFVARKVKDPLFDYEPVYGPIFKMRRHGKNGKIIHVYKMRTMHAYSEFIQKYVYEKHDLAEGGKLNNDFRVSSLGKFFRKYWIDELPMVLNLLKGDLKLVGVRPLSSHYLSLYSEELQEIRKRHKPGLIPPFYVDLPKTLDEIQQSELNYLRAYEQHPLRTDLRYFFRAGFNILVKMARSR